MKIYMKIDGVTEQIFEDSQYELAVSWSNYRRQNSQEEVGLLLKEFKDGLNIDDVWLVPPHRQKSRSRTFWEKILDVAMTPVFEPAQRGYPTLAKRGPKPPAS